MSTAVAVAVVVSGLALGWLVHPSLFGLAALAGTDVFLPGVTPPFRAPGETG